MVFRGLFERAEFAREFRSIDRKEDCGSTQRIPSASPDRYITIK